MHDGETKDKLSGTGNAESGTRNAPVGIAVADEAGERIAALIAGLKKQGWKTSGFWMTLLGLALLVLGVVEDRLPAETAATIGAVLMTAYKAARVLTTIGVAKQAAAASQPVIEVGEVMPAANAERGTGNAEQAAPRVPSEPEGMGH